GGAGRAAGRGRRRLRRGPDGGRGGGELGGVGRRRFARAARELLDLSLCGVELAAAEGVELLAALPQRERFVERNLAALEALDDLLELRLGLLERRFFRRAHCATSSTRAPKPPSASVTSTRTPGVTSALEETSRESVRTTAYPRRSVCNGDNAASLAAEFSSPARFRSTASAGACRSRSRARSRRRPSRSRPTRGAARSRSAVRVSFSRFRSSERRTSRASASRARSSLS